MKKILNFVIIITLYFVHLLLAFPSPPLPHPFLLLLPRVSFYINVITWFVYIHTKKRRHSFFFYVHNKKKHIFLRPELVFRFCYGSSLSHSYLFLPRSVRERNDIFWQKKRPSVRQMFHIHVTPFNAKRKKRFQRCVCVYVLETVHKQKWLSIIFSFFFLVLRL